MDAGYIYFLRNNYITFSVICQWFFEKNLKTKENVKMVTLLEVIIAKLKKMSPEQLHEIYAYIRKMKNK